MAPTLPSAAGAPPSSNTARNVLGGNAESVRLCHRIVWKSLWQLANLAFQRIKKKRKKRPMKQLQLPNKEEKVKSEMHKEEEDKLKADKAQEKIKVHRYIQSLGIFS